MFSCFRFARLETITVFFSIAESTASGYLKQATGSVRDGEIRSRAHAPFDQRPPFSVPALRPDHKNRKGGHCRLPGPWSLRLSVLCSNKAPRQASDVHGNLTVGKATYNKPCCIAIKILPNKIFCDMNMDWKYMLLEIQSPCWKFYNFAIFGQCMSSETLTIAIKPLGYWFMTSEIKPLRH